MDDHSDLFLNRKELAQILFSLSNSQLTRFRERFPTPILDEQVEAALKLALSILQHPKPRKA